MNNRIYSYWGNGTNTNTNNIRGPFYSNIQIFKYSCSSLSAIGMEEGGGSAIELSGREEGVL